MSIRLAAGSLLCLLLLAGCGRGMEDLEAYVTEVKSRKSARVDPIPQIKQYESFTYEIGSRRDPFVAVAPEQKQAASAGPKPDLNRNREPLEEFPLDALVMQGIIRYGSGTFALVKAPDGVIHRITVGNHLGQNYGEVTAIAETEIQLSELVPDGFGGWVQRPAVLALKE